MPYVKAAEYERLQAAEEACFTALIAIGLGFMDAVAIPTRQLVAEHGLQKWVNMAARDGLLRDEEDEAPT